MSIRYVAYILAAGLKRGRHPHELYSRWFFDYLHTFDICVSDIEYLYHSVCKSSRLACADNRISSVLMFTVKQSRVCSAKHTCSPYAFVHLLTVAIVICYGAELQSSVLTFTLHQLKKSMPEAEKFCLTEWKLNDFSNTPFEVFRNASKVK